LLYSLLYSLYSNKKIDGGVTRLTDYPEEQCETEPVNLHGSNSRSLPRMVQPNFDRMARRLRPRGSSPLQVFPAANGFSRKKTDKNHRERPISLNLIVLETFLLKIN
jgi:hypothetical protein